MRVLPLLLFAACAVAAARASADGSLEPAALADNSAFVEVEVGTPSASERVYDMVNFLNIADDWLDTAGEFKRLQDEEPDVADQLYMVRTMAKLGQMVGKAPGTVRHKLRKTAYRVLAAVGNQVFGSGCPSLLQPTGGTPEGFDEHTKQYKDYRGDFQKKQDHDAKKEAKKEKKEAENPDEVADAVIGKEKLSSVELFLVMYPRIKAASKRTEFMRWWKAEVCAKKCTGDNVVTPDAKVDASKFCQRASNTLRALARSVVKWADKEKDSEKAENYREMFFTKVLEEVTERRDGIDDAEEAKEAKEVTEADKTLIGACKRVRGFLLFAEAQENKKIAAAEKTIAAVRRVTETLTDIAVTAGSAMSGGAIGAAVKDVGGGGNDGQIHKARSVATTTGAAKGLSAIVNGKMVDMVGDAVTREKQYRAALLGASAEMFQGSDKEDPYKINGAECRQKLLRVAATWLIATTDVKEVHEHLKEGNLDDLHRTLAGEVDKELISRAYKKLHKLDDRMAASQAMLDADSPDFFTTVAGVMDAGADTWKLVDSTVLKADRDIQSRHAANKNADLLKRIDENTTPP